MKAMPRRFQHKENYKLEIRQSLYSHYNKHEHFRVDIMQLAEEKMLFDFVNIANGTNKEPAEIERVDYLWGDIFINDTVAFSNKWHLHNT
ncbi:hypothetical protein LCGC14_2723310, partial [marine sediment metagenome]